MDRLVGYDILIGGGVIEGLGLRLEKLEKSQNPTRFDLRIFFDLIRFEVRIFYLKRYTRSISHYNVIVVLVLRLFLIVLPNLFPLLMLFLFVCDNFDKSITRSHGIRGCLKK